MTRRPTDQELVEAVQEHLARVVESLTEPRLKYQTLVAAHVLGVVARGLAQSGKGPDDTEEDAALCRAIRAGEMDDPAALSTLVTRLHARVEADVAVWNPAFLPRVRGQ